MDDLSRRAVAAALTVAGGLGLRCGDDPEVIADGSNVLIHLAPAPVVARIATTTALVRKPAARWLALDLDIAGYLAAPSFPVVHPSRELPPGPHHRDGFSLTFWEYIEHERSYVANAQEVGPLLRDLHAALRDYRGALHPLSPFTEIPQWLDEVASWSQDEVASWNQDEVDSRNTVDLADIAMLRRGFTAVSAEIDALHLPDQPLHGDAHKKMSSRAIKVSSGPTSKTPASAPSSGISPASSALLSSHATSPSPATAEISIQTASSHFSPLATSRERPGGAILSTHFPDRKERATEWMAVARSRYG